MSLFAQQQGMTDSHQTHVLNYRSEVALSKLDLKTNILSEQDADVLRFLQK